MITILYKQAKLHSEFFRAHILDPELQLSDLSHK